MRVTRRHVLRALAAGGIGTLGTGFYGFALERRRLTVTRMVLPVTGLPPALSGLRIGLVSDLHFGEFTGSAMVAAVSARLGLERPDLIALAGDYVTWSDRVSVRPCADALSPLSAPHGVYAVLGNHDPEQAVRPAFEAAGFAVLRDQQVTIEIRGEKVSIAGLRYWSRRPADLSRALSGASGFPILLAHDPRRVGLARDAGVPLVLSCHTHGGQVVLPVLGAPAKARFPVVHGLARRGATTLFVTRGVGTVVLPVRVNCPPEVAILTLEQA